jgi:flavodoxin
MNLTVALKSTTDSLSLEKSNEERTMEQIIYFSKGGNTRKIADAMADELGIKATDVSQAQLNKDASLIFLASGSYGGKPSPKIIDFIKANDFKGKHVALFGTSGAGEGKQLPDMETAVKAQGGSIKGRFDCKGKFMLFNRGRPNQDDLTAAKQYAKTMTKTP